MVVHYDFEPPESVLDGFIVDKSGHDLYGELTTVGTGTNYLVADTPAALKPCDDTQSLFLRESGDFNGARLSAPISQSTLDFDAQDWTFAALVQTRDQPRTTTSSSISGTAMVSARLTNFSSTARPTPALLPCDITSAPAQPMRT